jgi:hypothetical protein
MDIDKINVRVDAALADNKRAEHIVIAMSVGIFLLGAGAFLFAYVEKNPYVVGGGLLTTAFLYWPIREILKLRRDNLILQVVPAMAAQLSAAEFAKEMKKLLEHLRSKK